MRENPQASGLLCPSGSQAHTQITCKGKDSKPGFQEQLVRSPFSTPTATKNVLNYRLVDTARSHARW